MRRAAFSLRTAAARGGRPSVGHRLELARGIDGRPHLDAHVREALGGGQEAQGVRMQRRAVGEVAQVDLEEPDHRSRVHGLQDEQAARAQRAVRLRAASACSTAGGRCSTTWAANTPPSDPAGCARRKSTRSPSATSSALARQTATAWALPSTPRAGDALLAQQLEELAAAAAEIDDGREARRRARRSRPGARAGPRARRGTGSRRRRSARRRRRGRPRRRRPRAEARPRPACRGSRASLPRATSTRSRRASSPSSRRPSDSWRRSKASSTSSARVVARADDDAVARVHHGQDALEVLHQRGRHLRPGARAARAVSVEIAVQDLDQRGVELGLPLEHGREQLPALAVDAAG